MSLLGAIVAVIGDPDALLLRQRGQSRPRPTPIASSTCSATCSSASAPTMSRSPDDNELIESAINGMLTGLDPHSSYLSPKNFKDMQVQTSGKFGGLGIEVTMEDGRDQGRLADRRHARRQGRHPRRRPDHRASTARLIQGLTLNEAVEKMRGPINTPITLTIERDGRREALRREARPRRDHHPVGALAPGGRRRLHPHHLLQRADLRRPQGGHRQAREAISGADKVKGYVIDLRNNPGGLLDQAIAVSDAFLDRGEIVSTRGRHADETQRYNAHSGDLADGKPVIVLVNGGSASASEIVAGALQDHRRATIIGTRSFGKGSVQTIIPLGANGALRLTTARYYTPSGRSIQAKGIDPDIEVIQELPPELAEQVGATSRAARRASRATSTARTCKPARSSPRKRNPDRWPMSRRTRRTTSSSTTRSTCCAAFRSTAPSRRTRPPAFRTDPAASRRHPDCDSMTKGRWSPHRPSCIWRAISPSPRRSPRSPS